MELTHPRGWQQFLNMCLALKERTELDGFLGFLLTAEEREQIATRILLTKALLEKKKPQREIAKELKISIAKITRGSNALKMLDEKQIAMLKQLMNAL